MWAQTYEGFLVNLKQSKSITITCSRFDGNLNPVTYDVVVNFNNTKSILTSNISKEKAKDVVEFIKGCIWENRKFVDYGELIERDASN